MSHAFHVLFAAQQELLLELVSATADFAATATSNESLKNRAAVIEKIWAGLPSREDCPALAAAHIHLEFFATKHPCTTVRATALCADAIDAEVAKTMATDAAHAFAMLKEFLKPKVSTVATTATAAATVVQVTQAAATTATSFKPLQTLRSIFAAALKMWQDTTMRTAKDGAPALEVQVSEFISAMLNKSSSPSFTNDQKNRGVEGLRQALLSHREIAPLFHVQQYKADSVITINAAMKNGVGQGTTRLALAVLATMFWLSAERTVNITSLPIALAVESLLIDADAIMQNTATAMKQEELYTITLSEEVAAFVNSVADPRPANLGWDGPAWSDSLATKRTRTEQTTASLPRGSSISANDWRGKSRFQSVSYPRGESPLPREEPRHVTGENGDAGCRGCFKSHQPAQCWVKHPHLRNKGAAEASAPQAPGKAGGAHGKTASVRPVPPPPVPQ